MRQAMTTVNHRHWLRAGPARPKRRCARQLLLEILEDRLAPATFTVTNTSDDPSNAGSLRHALAGAIGDSNTIDFDPNLSGTILLTHGALVPQGAVTING